MMVLATINQEFGGLAESGFTIQLSDYAGYLYDIL